MATYYFDDDSPHDHWREFEAENDEKAIAFGEARRLIRLNSIVYACDRPGEGAEAFRTIKEWKPGEPKISPKENK
jgi:hypothetical protein